MSYYLNKIVVVEGKEDVSYLSSFINAEYITTNGYDIPKEEIDYLNTASEYKEILVLVDPDKAGRDIENRLKKVVNKATYLNVNIDKCIRGKKNGIAECDKEEIVKTLTPYFENEIQNNNGVFAENFFEYDLLNKDFRQYLSRKFHLGKCNLKKIFVRLKTLGITPQEVKLAWEEYHGN